MSRVSAYVHGTVVVGSVESFKSKFSEALLVTSLGLDLKTLARHLNGEFSLRSLPFGERHCAFACRQLSCLDEPYRGSPQSDARYWIVHPFPQERTLLLVQYLPPHAQTSVHWHPAEKEWFYALEGVSTLHYGRCDPQQARNAHKQGDISLFPGPVDDLGWAVVLPEWVHQLTTTDDPALNLIVVKGTDARTLTELNHQYVTWE